MEQKFMLNFSLCGKKKEKFVIYYQRDLAYFMLRVTRCMGIVIIRV